MNGLSATLIRELRSYFVSPLAWVVMTLFLLLNGIVFSLLIAFLNQPGAGAVTSPLEVFFGQNVLFWFILLVVCPALTMRALSEERRSGTIEALMTSPVTEVQVVAGKFLAAWTFYAVLWLPTLLYAVILDSYGEVDWGPVASGYLGILGVGALLLSVGIFASSLARSQIVAALFAFTGSFALLSATFVGDLVVGDSVGQVVAHLSLWEHLGEFGRGIVDTRRLVYYASTTIFFLFASTRALASNKWR